MNYAVIIPAHNEALYIGRCLDSVVSQSCLPNELIVVNDHSTDHTEEIVNTYRAKYPFIKLENRISGEDHLPGSKVVAAFNQGFQQLEKDWEYVVKLDADIELPSDYFESVLAHFKKNPKLGIAGGFAYEQDSQGNWKLAHSMNKKHVRGAFKTYSKACFNAMNGLREAMGWDTADELLAQYHGFEVDTLESLHVAHWRPIGSAYNQKAKWLQGQAMFRLRYGILITAIASLKIAVNQNKIKLLFDYLAGYRQAKKLKIPYIVSEEEGIFIRKLRWKGILSKLF